MDKQLTIHVRSLVKKIPDALFIRLWASVDAKPLPAMHEFELVANRAIQIKWTHLQPSDSTLLCWECVIKEQAPLVEGGEIESVIIGGTVTSLSGSFVATLTDFYSQKDERIAEMDVFLEGLPDLPSIHIDPMQVKIMHEIMHRYIKHYQTIEPASACDEGKFVPFFNFYGGGVQASFLALLRGGLDEQFAVSILDIVLSDAGMNKAELIQIGRSQLQRTDAVYQEETTALILRMSELLTFTSNIMRYRTDLSSPAKPRREIIEKIIPHVREEHAGDCEDLALEIYFCFHALQELTQAKDEAIKILAQFAQFYLPGLATVVATAPAVGKMTSGGLILHLIAVGLPITIAKKRLPTIVSDEISHQMPAWTKSLPTLLPLEGTNWVSALHLPVDRFYGQNKDDVIALNSLFNAEKFINSFAPGLRIRHPPRIHQQLGVALNVENFSTFYRSVIEVWMDFSSIGITCFSVHQENQPFYGVPISLLALGQDYELVPIFQVNKAELESVKFTMRTVAPIMPWVGSARPIRLKELDEMVSSDFLPEKASRLFANSIVYHIRSRTMARSIQLRHEIEDLKEHNFIINYRGWEMPPNGDGIYVALYVQEK